MFADSQFPSGVAKVFFALWPDAATQAALAAWQSILERHCGGRMMRPETLHVTLVFVGAIRQDKLPQLEAAAQAVFAQPFELVLDRVHYWEHNHIVCAVPDAPPPVLMQLAADLGERLRERGIVLESRAYRPHVTLMRNVHGSSSSLLSLPAVVWQVGEFALMQSLPQQYRPLAHYRLRDAGAL